MGSVICDNKIVSLPPCNYLDILDIWRPTATVAAVILIPWQEVKYWFQRALIVLMFGGSSENTVFDY